MKAAEDFTVLTIRFPTLWPPAIRRAAQQQTLSASNYIRLAVRDQLKRDGIDPFDGDDRD
jgi:hypothetical protein